MIPESTSTTTTTGTSKAMPKAKNIPRTKFFFFNDTATTEMLLGAKLVMNANTRPNTTK